MKKRAFTLAACLAAILSVSSGAYALPGIDSYTTIPAGTNFGNSNYWSPDNPFPSAQAISNVGHIAILKSANMAVTTDQPFTMLTYAMSPYYMVTSVYAFNCNVSPSGAVGGIYTAAAKGGTQVVAAAQTYAALGTPTTWQPLTVNVPTTGVVSSSTLYFSLTTGGPASTCDIYVDGIGFQ